MMVRSLIMLVVVAVAGCGGEREEPPVTIVEVRTEVVRQKSDPVLPDADPCDDACYREKIRKLLPVVRKRLIEAGWDIPDASCEK